MGKKDKRKGKKGDTSALLGPNGQGGVVAGGGVGNPIIKSTIPRTPSNTPNGILAPRSTPDSKRDYGQQNGSLYHGQDATPSGVVTTQSGTNYQSNSGGHLQQNIMQASEGIIGPILTPDGEQPTCIPGSNYSTFERSVNNQNTIQQNSLPMNNTILSVTSSGNIANRNDNSPIHTGSVQSMVNGYDSGTNSLPYKPTSFHTTIPKTPDSTLERTSSSGVGPPPVKSIAPPPPTVKDEEMGSGIQDTSMTNPARVNTPRAAPPPLITKPGQTQVYVSSTIPRNPGTPPAKRTHAVVPFPNPIPPPVVDSESSDEPDTPPAEATTLPGVMPVDPPSPVPLAPPPPPILGQNTPPADQHNPPPLPIPPPVMAINFNQGEAEVSEVEIPEFAQPGPSQQGEGQSQRASLEIPVPAPSALRKSANNRKKVSWNESVVVTQEDSGDVQVKDLQELDHEYNPIEAKVPAGARVRHLTMMDRDNELTEAGEELEGGVLDTPMARERQLARERRKLEQERAQLDEDLPSLTYREEGRFGLRLCLFLLLFLVVASTLAVIVLALLYSFSIHRDWTEEANSLRSKLSLEEPRETADLSRLVFPGAWYREGDTILYLVEDSDTMPYLIPDSAVSLSWHQGKALEIISYAISNNGTERHLLGDPLSTKDAVYTMILFPTRFYSARILGGEKYSLVSTVSTAAQQVSWTEG